MEIPVLDFQAFHTPSFPQLLPGRAPRSRAHSRITLLPRVIGFGRRWQVAPSPPRWWCCWFSRPLRDFGVGEPLASVANLATTIFPLADHYLRPRWCIPALARHLPQTVVVTHHPAVAQRPLRLQPQDFLQLPWAGAAPMEVLGLGRQPRETPVVLWQIFPHQKLIGRSLGADVLPPHLY